VTSRQAETIECAEVRGTTANWQSFFPLDHVGLRLSRRFLPSQIRLRTSSYAWPFGAMTRSRLCQLREITVANFLLVAASVLGLSLDSVGQVTVSQILAARRAVYCDSCPAGRLKVFASFHMEVEKPNPALGGDYFPVSDLTGKVANLRSWREETFRSGRRYKARVVSYAPAGYRGAIPGTYDLTQCYDGSHSWRYRPTDRVSERFNGVTKATQIIQDYYGDMIGSKIPGGSPTMSRTVSAQSEYEYDLDQVVASGLYQVVGEEKFAGEICTVIDSPGIDRIWLANEKNFLVVKREWRWTKGGPLKRRIINSEFRPIGRGVWLPFSGRMEVFSHPNTPPERRVGVLTAVVELADTDFPDSEFEPSFLKGTVVNDAETGKQSVAGYTEEELEVEQAKGVLKKIKGRESVEAFAFQAPPWWRRNWLALLGIILIPCFAAYLLRRQRNK